MIHPPPYRHEAMGLVEWFNHTIVDHMRKIALAQGKNWVNCVGEALEVYNSTYHNIIRAVPQ